MSKRENEQTSRTCGPCVLAFCPVAPPQGDCKRREWLSRPSPAPASRLCRRLALSRTGAIRPNKNSKRCASNHSMRDFP